MATKFTSINGITIHVCRKIAPFSFGPKNVFAVRYNYPEVCYNIYVRDIEGLEKQTQWFKKFWGPGFNVIPVSEDKIHTIPSTRGTVPIPS